MKDAVFRVGFYLFTMCHEPFNLKENRENRYNLLGDARGSKTAEAVQVSKLRNLHTG